MIKNENGLLIITDGPEVIYDSSVDKLFHYLPPRIDGSFNRPGQGWSGAGNPGFIVDDFSIGTLPSAATDIVGLVRFQYSTGYEYLPSGAWFVAGGSFVLALKAFQLTNGNWGSNVSSAYFASIYNNGTDLRFRAEMSLWDNYMAGPGLALAPYTVTYRLFPAVFS